MDRGTYSHLIVSLFLSPETHPIKGPSKHDPLTDCSISHRRERLPITVGANTLLSTNKLLTARLYSLLPSASMLPQNSNIYIKSHYQ